MRQLIEICRFECIYQLRSKQFYFLLLLFTAVYALAATNIGIVPLVSEQKLDSAFNVIQVQVLLGMLMIFPAIAISASSITRDYDYNTKELLFVTLASKTSFLLGRSLAGFIFTVIVGLAGLIGTRVGYFLPWVNSEQLEGLQFEPFWYGFRAVVIPNAFIITSLFVSAVIWTRSVSICFSIILFFIALIPLPNTEITAFFEPLGIRAYLLEIRYWSALEMTNNTPAGKFIMNKGFWIFISGTLLAISMITFKYPLNTINIRLRPFTKNHPETEGLKNKKKKISPFIASFAINKRLLQFISQLRMDIRGVLSSQLFYIVMIVSILSACNYFYSGAEALFGVSVFPVTALLVDFIGQSSNQFLVIIILYYSGDLVWRERQAMINEMVDTTAVSSSVMLMAKVLALSLIVCLVLTLLAFTFVVLQAINGFTRFDFGIYLQSIFIYTVPQYLLFCILAVLIQVSAPNKWTGHFIFILACVSWLIMPRLGFDHLLYGFSIPFRIYSEMNGYSPYGAVTNSLILYWGFFAVLLLIVSYLLFPRGYDENMQQRLAVARLRADRKVLGASSCAFLGLICCGTWIFYNTSILNDYRSPIEQQAIQALYEIRYGQYRNMALPETVSIDAEVDIFPAERRIDSKGLAVLTSLELEPLHEYMLTLNAELEVKQLALAGAQLVETDSELGMYRFHFDKPLMPGESTQLIWSLTLAYKGFTNSASNTEIVENGTVVFSGRIMPIPGYDESIELDDALLRHRNGLPEQYSIPSIEEAVKLNKKEESTERRDKTGRTHYTSVVSTSANQVAVSQGKLVNEWTDEGRRYFQYELRRPSPGVVSFQSARYIVAKDEWKDIPLEVFYDAQHPFAVAKMLETAKQGLEYFSANFSPYQHEQFRIIEFPRYFVAARALSGAVPISEGLGFQADYSNLNSVEFTIAHELSHQWWGRQILDAEVEGAGLLIETLASYSALILNKNFYGEDSVRLYTEQMMEGYFRRRSLNAESEKPLTKDYYSFHLSYWKGPLVMYALQDMIGEDVLNKALQSFLKKYAFAPVPFPTALDLINELRAVTPQEHQQLITDFFEKITVYDLRIDDTEIVKTESGVNVVVDLTAKKVHEDGSGKQTEAPLNTWFDVVVFAEESAQGGRQVLYEQKHLLRSGSQTITINVQEAPGSVAVDPYRKMIEKNVSDNRQTL